MGNNTSSPVATQEGSSTSQHSQVSSRFNKKLMNGAISNKRSTPKITRLEAKGEMIRSDRRTGDMTTHEEQERQRSIGSDGTANDISIESTTSTSSLSSISSSSMVDADDDNVFQHIEEIDKDIEYHHIEGVGLSGGDTISRNNEDEKFAVSIKWPNSGHEKEVYIIGDFTNWKKKLKLQPSGDSFIITLNLPKGLYKIQFLINNREMKITSQLPMATDNEGNIVNWFEVYGSAGKAVTPAPSQYEEISNNDNIGTPIEAGSIENRRLGRKTMSVEHFRPNPILSPSSEQSSGRSTPMNLFERGGSNSPSSQARNYPYNTNQRHISNQSTISGYSVTNDNSSVNSVSTFHYRKPVVSKLNYTSELPDIYYNEELAYPYPSLEELDSSSYYKKINFEEYLTEKLELPIPPELPAYLGSLLINDDHDTGHHHSKNNKLNDLNVDKYTGLNYSGLDSIPNHVILKHLITTNIKNNVIMVTVINRYEGKYVYQALYSPVDI